MGRQANGGSGGRQENKRWSLIPGPRFLTIFVVISMIHVATSQDKMSTLDQGSNIVRSPRNAKATGKTNTQSNRVCNTQECIDTADKIGHDMNLTVDPCDDFYEYACGRWPINHIRPAGYKYYSIIQIAELKTEEYKRRKMEKGGIRISGATREVQQMPSDLYNSCMNLTIIEKLDNAPLRERIRELGGWSMSGNWDKNKWDFNKTLISIHKMEGGGPLFQIGLVPSSNITKTFYILQPNLALKKGHYLNLTSKTMLAYRQLIIDVVLLLDPNGNNDTIAKKADEMIRFEARIANVSYRFAEWQPYITNTRTLEQLQQEVHEINWSDYLNKLFAPFTVPKSEIITLPTLPYLKKAMKIVEDTSKSVLANHMVWYVIRTELGWLSKPFRDVQLKYKKVKDGIKTVKKRWKTCAASAFVYFKEIITAAYISENQAEMKNRRSLGNTFLNEATQAFKDNVNSLTWLDHATKIGAIEKMQGMDLKIGFPDYMLDSTKMAALLEKFNGIIVKNETFYENKVSISKKLRQNTLNDLRKPRDKTKWDVSPLDGRPEYSSLQNRFTLPAAVIQPPVIYPNKFLRAYNLGKFGFIIGHEMMHGFGHDGRVLDKNGNKKNWWSKKSLLEFNKRMKCYEKQYSAYKILGKYPIDGKKQIEENVADSGALKIAVKAYYNWAKLNPSETWRLPGLNFTNEQLFFVGFAQLFCSTSTFKDRIDFIKYSSHTDDKFRIIGSLSNSCEFANAFKCKMNSPMNPIKKCYLWSKEGPLV